MVERIAGETWLVMVRDAMGANHLPCECVSCGAGGCGIGGSEDVCGSGIVWSGGGFVGGRGWAIACGGERAGRAWVGGA